MAVLKSILVSLSMFTRVPMPRVEWDKKSLRYTMAAFPLAGLLVGLAVLLWDMACGFLGFGPLLYGVGLTLLPVLVTGGIHLDGFCDTTDALASHAPTEKKLEILADSHIGAFAAIGVVCYLLAFAAFGGQLLRGSEFALCFMAGFVLSRALSGLAVVLFPKAKGSGLAHAFADAAARRASAVALVLFLALACVPFVVWGLYLPLLLAAACFYLYYRTAKKQFGGTTGDLAGWFLQLCELCVLIGTVCSQQLGGGGML